MEKEKWIEHVFASTKGMKRLDPSPFLFEKISEKVKAKSQSFDFAPSVAEGLPQVKQDDVAQSDRIKRGTKWAFGLTAALIVTINIFSIGKATVGKQHLNDTELGIVTEFNNAVVYTY